MDVIKGKLALIKLYAADIERELKRLEKEKKKCHGEKQCVRKGIHMPSVVSPLLLSFMGLESGSLVSRTEFNSFLAKYIKANQLYVVGVSGKKELIPNAAILQLMDKTKQVPSILTYFNIQGLFNHLFNVHH